MIRMNDFQRMWQDIGEDVHSAVTAVGESGWYVLGNEVRSFERELAGFWPAADAVGCASGLDAIELALRCGGIGSGDKVLTTPLSAFATTLAIVKCGAIPVFVDVDETGLIDLEQCQDVLKKDPEIKALVPVHLYGQALNLDQLNHLVQSSDLLLIEDCAQSIAATWNGRATGSVGKMAATSFYPTKNLGCLGDGGAVIVNDPSCAGQLRRIRDYGQSKKYVHSELGLNSRLDELQAAILRRAMLPRLSAWTQRRIEIASRYNAEIESSFVRTIQPKRETVPSWHLYSIFVPEKRDELQTALSADNIESGAHYPSLIPDQPAMKGIQHEIAFSPVKAAAICRTQLSIPVHPYISDHEISAVIAKINEFR